MLETNTKNWEQAVLEKGIGIGAENMQIQMVEQMAKNGIANSDIQKITGLSLGKIAQIRKKVHITLRGEEFCHLQLQNTKEYAVIVPRHAPGSPG